MKTISKVNAPSVYERIQRIDRLNLEAIMVKLMDEKEGKSWNLEQAFTAESWYKRYLKLNLLYPNKSIVPNSQIDDFWHYHILDTMKYAEDCEYIFGYFLHHFPYFGLRGEADAANLARSYEETLELFSKEFGEEIDILYRMFSKEITCTGSNCGNSDVNDSFQSGCDSGPGSCHVSCYSACHANPVTLDLQATLAIPDLKRNQNIIRPTLASLFQ